MTSAGSGGVVPGAASLSPASLLLLSAAFIILSADMAVGRQCYWCGPLAEQVHRSRRAPACEGGGRHITVCEPGFEHCAMVAVSPPYVESRYCVKLYQDECYPLFCNSTKTWKMTCPCRGDLCNGVKGDREMDAFAVLGKLVAKTHSHVNKRTPTLQLTGNRKARIINPDEQNDEPMLTNNSIDEEQIRSETFMMGTGTQLPTESNHKNPKSEHTSPTNADSVDESKTKTDASASAENTPSIIKEEISAIIQPTSVKDESVNFDILVTSTTMIEIDIIHKSNLETSTQGSVMQDVDVQGDEPVQLNDQADEVDKHEMGNKPPETASDIPKPQTVENMTSVSSSVDEANNLKPDSTDPVQKDISPPKSSEETETPAPSTMLPTTANTITTTMSKKSSKDKNKKNTALRLSVNIIIITQCILLSFII
ncbi:hypothetical protein O0L34_g3130 [Tuta absoluta]|nr:hypothetical protein O0L34_g3130 [Tuta absoluta]